ncbi:MAG: hypothetical protein IBJ03_05295 [Gemmatimonadaceae bacterium]|nr:hypothetical protein [Gemmatimonadaceae bacterium]
MVSLPPSIPGFPADDVVPVPGELLDAPIVAPPPPPPPPPVLAPVGWLLNAAGAGVQGRLFRDVLPWVPGMRTAVASGVATGNPSALSRLPYASRSGWHLLGQQQADGTWPAGWLSVPNGTTLTGVGTIPAYRRLLELGWDAESPALQSTRRALYRLLAEDLDPTVLAELRPPDDDEELVLHGRRQLREAAAAALAHAGYEADPRLRGAARRLVDRVHAFLRSPLAAKPWIRQGNQHVLHPDAAPPSFHLLAMLAHMPSFCSEQGEFMDRLFIWLTQPWPRQSAVQVIGDSVSDQPELALGDFLATRTALDSDIVSALAWLEIVARLGFVSRHEGWGRLLDRMLGDRDRHGVWTPPRSVVMPVHVPVWAWPAAPLFDAAWEDAQRGWSVDVTFRLVLTAQLAGRELLLG